MDVRGILKSEAADLLDDELAMLEEELATGGYDRSYVVECKRLIDGERHAREVARLKAQKASEGQKHAPQRHEKAEEHATVMPGVVLPSTAASTLNALSPFNEAKEGHKSPYEVVLADVSVLRRSERYKTLFREYIRKQSFIDEQFVDAHLSLFNEWETTALLDRMRFSEAFLEKYLSVLDARKVATTQTFSEEFFMRHFGYFNAETVLTKGKNKWRTKDARSRKLDTFLRIKGVRC